jgi:hypothetical protein
LFYFLVLPGGVPDKKNAETGNQNGFKPHIQKTKLSIFGYIHRMAKLRVCRIKNGPLPAFIPFSALVR